MSQTVFNHKGTAIRPKCIDCGIILGNYSYWFEGEGPLCHICNSKRVEERVDILDKNVKDDDNE